MSRPRKYKKIDYDLQHHKAYIEETRFKREIWVIRGKIQTEPNPENVKAVEDRIYLISRKYMKTIAQRHIVDVQAPSSDSYRKNRIIKTSHITYSIVFKREGEIEDIFVMTAPMMEEIDQAVM